MAGQVGVEPEAPVIRLVADEQHGPMAEPFCRNETALDQSCADTPSAVTPRRRRGAQQQCVPPATDPQMSETNGADELSSIQCNETQAGRR